MTTFETLEEEEWDIEECRGTHESDEHWELRRNFLSTNKGRFLKLRLLSLSQVFVNVEFLGCKYPDETMDLVVEMSTGIVEEYRRARQGRLQRTFVKASDAAEKKSKGTKRHVNHTPSSSVGEHKVFIRESSSCTLTSASSLRVPCITLTNEQYEQALDQYGNDLRGLVLVDQVFQENEGALQILNRSCGMSHKRLVITYSVLNVEGDNLCRIQIGESFSMEGTGFTKEVARKNAATKAIQELRKLCYTIEVKANVVAATEFGKTDINGLAKGVKEDGISVDNVGSKLLKLMGWQGGGLGKDEQGIQTPIQASSSEIVQRSRLGLGLASVGADFSKALTKFLKNQMWQCDQFDLQFTPEFSSDERKIIHQIAGALKLKSRSHGKGEDRYLVVSRKIQLTQLLQELLDLGESPKYRVMPPELMTSGMSNQEDMS